MRKVKGKMFFLRSDIFTLNQGLNDLPWGEKVVLYTHRKIEFKGEESMRKKGFKKLISSVLVTVMLASCVGVISPQAAVADYEAGKVLELSFENNVNDSSSKGNNGTLNNAGTYVDGVNGKAIKLGGSTYIDMGKSADLQPAKLTFATWVKADAALSGEHIITWFKPSGNYQGEGWYLSCLDDNTPLKLSVGKSSGQPYELFVSGSRKEFFPVGEWVHIAVTYDSTTHTACIYRNGIAQDVQTINAQLEINADANSNKYIGFNSPGYNGGFANVSLDELVIYSEVLDSSSIVELYTKYGAEFDTEEVVNSDYESLNISIKSTKNSIKLPMEGNSGSAITWTSSNTAVIANDGTVTRPAAGENDALVTLTAKLSFGGFEKEKSFEVNVEAMPAFTDLDDFKLSEVELLDAYEVNAFEKEIAYLKKLDDDKLLKGFTEIGKVASTATKYGGWENSSIQGHTLGHYLTAVSQAYGATGDEQLLEIVNHIVDVLAECQADNGYVAAIPESHYVQIENGNTAGTWVPWYTMHKVMAGLIDAYEEAGNEKALDVASKLGDWVYSRTSKWTEATQTTVLNVEYGGMNDCLYQLYKHTKSENHLSAAHSFDEMTLFDALYNGQDVLNGKHANTTIPKIIGALNRYITLGEGEEYYLAVAENFWEIVVNNHTYITGGNSEWEHFGEANILDAERTNCNCETCNTYNMLKLSRELFKITGNKKYSDYYETTFINAILSSQNPETGMTTYFQPMATGFFKVYSSETNHFWCCTGSGMESFSKLNDSIYYKDANAIYVIQFASSKVTDKDKNIVLTQESDIPNSDTTKFTINTISGDTTEADIVLRVPDWAAGDVTVKVNGAAKEVKVVNGFITLADTWKNKDSIEYSIPMKVVAYDLPDNENVVAFKYGPVVLSGNLGNESMNTSTTGVNVTTPLLNVEINDTIRIKDGLIADWLANVADNVVKTDGKLEFTLKGTDRGDVVFTPHYQVYAHRYGIYFDLVDSTTVKDDSDDDKYEVIDSLPVANDQYEFSHNMKAQLSSTGMHKGLNYRDASAGGFFSYELAVEEGVKNYIVVKYFSGDAGRAFTIYVDDEVLEEVTIENVDADNFYDVYYEIPAKMIEGKKVVTVKFTADKNGFAGGIFDKISMVKEKGAVPEKPTEEKTTAAKENETTTADSNTKEPQNNNSTVVLVICIVVVLAVAVLGVIVVKKSRTGNKSKEKAVVNAEETQVNSENKE